MAAPAWQAPRAVLEVSVWVQLGSEIELTR
jgi:hypothetical protein